MSTLMLRLAAPMQAWGSESKFDIRRTYTEPTKSGVIGLLMAALGCPKEDDETLHLLNKLHMGIRVDRAGEIMRDFHTAHPDKGTGYVTYRYYLNDAVFVVGLESDDDALLRRLDNALKTPVFPLFLGRRSCPPTLPLALGVRNTDLEESLQAEPCYDKRWNKNIEDKEMRLYFESKMLPKGCMARRLKCNPISFNQQHRRFSYYYLVEGNPVILHKEVIEDKNTEHDPFAEF